MQVNKRIFFLLSLFALCSCSPSRSGNYSREIYKKAWATRKSDLGQEKGEKGAENLTLRKKKRERWERRGEETVSEWVRRIEESMRENEDLLNLQKQRHALLKEEEAKYRDEIRQIAQRTLYWESQLQEGKTSVVGLKRENRSQKKFLSKGQLAPFTLHLVRKGETLYSIASKYYADSGKVEEIFSWNQGWLENREKVLAGMGLVLFFTDFAEKADPKFVETFLKRKRKI